MLKNFFIIVLFLILGNAVFPQSNIKQSKSPPIPSEIETIILEARTLQPELTIDILLKIISSGKVENKVKKKQILEEAFYLSFSAKEKIRRKIIAFEGQVLTLRPTFISYAFKYKLDTLSLQTRIVSELLKIDRVKAFELFNEIAPDLSLKPLSCQEFLLYEISEFYELVGKIAKESFTQNQIKQGQRITFLSSYVENITSVSQISPVIRMLSSSNLTDDEMSSLGSLFNKSLRRISGDDRSFSYEMNFGPTAGDISELSRKLVSNSTFYEEIRKSYKDYLIKNLQGTRCQDNVEYEKKTGEKTDDAQGENPQIKLPFYVYAANKFLLRDSPVTAEETKPFKVETFVFPTEYLVSGKSSLIFGKIRGLQNWEEENKTISEIKESLEWQEAFSNILEEIDDWKKSGNEDEIDLFHQKSLLYRILLNEASTIALKELVIKKHQKLLNLREIQREFVLEWFLGFNDLLVEIRETKSTERRQKLFEVLKNSNNTAISIYLGLETLIGSEKNNSKAKTVTPSK